MQRFRLAILLLVALQLFSGAALPCLAQEKDEVREPPATLHAGEWLTLQPRAKIQIDARIFRPEFPDGQKLLGARRARFGADGTILHDLFYTVRVETSKGDPQFRDVFLKYQRFGALQVQGGRFHIPFGLDQLTDSGDLDFVHRSRIGSIVAPGRDAGAMVLGKTAGGRLNYAAGLFRHDGRNSELEEFAAVDQTLPGGNRTAAAHVTYEPLGAGASSFTRDLKVGVAVTHGELTSGLSSLAGVTVANQVFFPRMFAKGTRLRRGAELSMSLGSLALKGELMEARDQRLDQGLNGEDLPDLKTQGWYVSAVQPLFGHVDNGHGFLRSLLPGTQLGLFEAGARYEVIRFGSVSTGGASPSRNARAANVIGNDDRAWTFGINWRATRYVRFQLNAVRETLHDPARTPIDGKSEYWTAVSRFQLYF